MQNLLETVEAVIFAAGKPIKKSDILEKMSDEVSRKNLNDAIKKLMDKYSGNCGILLLEFNDKVQFSSNPRYGDLVAEILKPVKEKQLSAVLLETLSIIAYKQPVTRLDIEEVRGVNSDYALSVLTKAGLVEAVGKKDTVGRPTLYATTEEFLKKFQLSSIEQLPDYETVLERLKIKTGDMFNVSTENLFRDVSGMVQDDEHVAATVDPETQLINEFMSTDEVPDFLDGDEFDVVE